MIITGEQTFWFFFYSKLPSIPQNLKNHNLRNSNNQTCEEAYPSLKKITQEIQD